MKKRIKQKILGISSLALLVSGAVGGAIGASTTFNQNYKTNTSAKTKDVEVKTVNNGYMTGEFGVENDQRLTIAKGYKTLPGDSSAINYAAPVPGGLVIPMQVSGSQSQLVVLDENSNKILANIGDKLNTINQSSSNSWLDSYYDASTSKIVSLVLNNNDLQVWTSNVNGQGFRKTTLEGITSAKQYAALVPVHNKPGYFISFVREFDNINTTMRNARIIQIQSDGSIAQTPFYSDSVQPFSSNDRMAIISLGAAWDNSKNKIVLGAAVKRDNDVSLITFEQGVQSNESNRKGINDSDNGAFSSADNIARYSSRMYFEANGDFKAAFVWNHNYKVGGEQWYHGIIKIWGSTTDGQSMNLETINLHRDGCRVQLENPFIYFDQQGNTLLYTSIREFNARNVTNPEWIKNDVAILKLNNWDEAPALRQTLDGSSKPQSPIADWNNQNQGQRFRIFNSNHNYGGWQQTEYRFFLPSYDTAKVFDMKYHQDTAEKFGNRYSMINTRGVGYKNTQNLLGTFAYHMRSKGDNSQPLTYVANTSANDRFKYSWIPFEMPGKENVSAFDATGDFGNIKDKFTEVKNNFTASGQATNHNEVQDLVKGLKQENGKRDAKWSYYYYKGAVPVRLTYSNAYVLGELVDNPNSIPIIGLATGYHQWETRIKENQNKIDISQIPELRNMTKSDFKNLASATPTYNSLVSWLNNNIKNRFDDAPVDGGVGTLYLNLGLKPIRENPDNPNELILTIQTTNAVGPNHELTSDGAYFDFIVYNFKPTEQEITMPAEIPWGQLTWDTPAPTAQAILDQWNDGGGNYLDIIKDNITDGRIQGLRPGIDHAGGVEITGITLTPEDEYAGKIQIQYNVDLSSMGFGKKVFISKITDLAELVQTTVDDRVDAKKPTELVSLYATTEKIRDILVKIYNDTRPNSFIHDAGRDFNIENDLTVNSIVSKSSANGEIVANITLNHIKGATAQQTTLTKNITLFNFKQQPLTEYVAEPNRTIDIGVHDRPTNQYTQDEAQHYILQNLSKFFVNNPSPLTTNDFAITNFDNTQINSGNVTFDLQILKYYSENGLIDPSSGQKDLPPVRFTFTGFKTDGLTTTIDQNHTFNPTLNFKASEWQANEQALKEAIANANIVHNLMPNQTLTADDITLANPAKINDATGTITLDITVSASKAWVDAVAHDVTQTGVVLTGFVTQAATEYRAGGGANTWVGKDQAANVYAEVANSEDAAKRMFLANWKTIWAGTPIILNGPDTLTLDNIKVVELGFDNVHGHLNASYRINKFYDSKGFLVNDANSWLGEGNYAVTPDKVSISYHGFKTDNLTTIIANPINLVGMDDVAPSLIVTDTAAQDKIKQQIIDNTVGTALGKPLELADVSFTVTSHDNTTGTAVIDVTISNSKAWENAQVQATKVFTGITLNGLKQVHQTAWVQPYEKTDASFGSMYADEYKTKDKVKEYVLAHKDQFFTNPAPSMTDDEIIVLADPTVNLANGTVQFELGLAKWTDADGVVQNDSSGNGFKQQFSFSGFETDGLTTTIANTITFDPALNFKASDWQANEQALKEAIANSNGITNLIHGTTLTADDITLANASGINNVNGTITLDITVSADKAWVNGTAQQVTQTGVVLNGFVTQGATAYRAGGGIEGWIGSDQAANVYAEAAANEEAAKNMFLANWKQFYNGSTAFENGPESLTIDNIKVVSVSADNKTGQVHASYRINKFYDANGILVDDPNTWLGEGNYPATPDNFNVSYQGFKHDNLTTQIANPINLTGLEEVVPSSIATDPIAQAKIKEAIIANTTGLALDGTLTEQDISFTVASHDNPNGTAIINVTISNSKAWNDAVVQETMNFDGIVLNGLKHVQSTSWVQPYEKQDQAFASMYADEYKTKDKVKEYVLAHKDQFYNFAPISLTDNDIIVIADPVVNLGQGTVQFELGLTKWINSDGNEQTDPSGNGFKQQFSFTGFKTDGLSTIIPTQITFSPALGFKASEWKPYEQTLKEAIVNANVITNLIHGTTLTAADITLSNPAEINDANGSIQLDITVSASKAWVDAVAHDVTQTGVTLTGFVTQAPTTYGTATSNQWQGSDQAANVYAETIKTNEAALKGMLAANWKTLSVGNPVINNAPEELAQSNIKVVEATADNAQGSITVKYRINKFFDAKGLLVDDASSWLGEGNFATTPDSLVITFQGFKKDQLTTAINAPINIPGQENVLASDINSNQATQTAIKQAIIASTTGLALGGTLTEQDVSFTVQSSNNIQGTAVIDVTISNSKAWQNGVVQETMAFNGLTINGFKNVKPTQWAINTTIEDAAFANLDASAFSEANIKEYIANNQAKFFTNPADGFNAQTDVAILSTTPDTVRGTLVIEIGLKKWTNDQGVIETNASGDSFKKQFTLRQFQHSQLTTAFDNSDLALNGVGQILASSVDINGTEAIVNQIKTEIAKRITGAANGQTVTADDIGLSNASANNKDGKLTVTVTLNNSKFWTDGGTPEASHEFTNQPITLTGFMNVHPTEWVSNTNVSDASFSSILATEQNYGLDQIKQFVVDHKAKFMTNEPTNLAPEEIVISGATWNTGAGQISFTLGLKRWFNNDGNIQQDEQATTFAKQFTLTGFKNTGLTTQLTSTSIKVNQPDALASALVQDINVDNAATQAIKAEIIKLIADPASPVEAADITLREASNANDALGTLTLKFTLNNNKYWVNGVTEQSHAFDQLINVSGLKKVDYSTLTTLKISSIDVGSSLFKQVFKNDGGFQIDWTSDTFADKAQILKEYIINNKGTFFNNPTANTTVNSLTIEGDAATGLIVKLTFTGMTVSGNEGELPEASFTIKGFKANPDLSAASGPINSAIQNAVNNFKPQGETLTEQEKQELVDNIKNEIAGAINGMIQNGELPNAWKPGSGQVDANSIEGNITIDAQGNATLEGLTANLNGNKLPLPNGTFNKQEQGYGNNSTNPGQYVIWIVVGTICGILLILLILIVTYIIKKKKLDKATFDITNEAF